MERGEWWHFDRHIAFCDRIQIAGERIHVPVRAEFTCPDSHTVLMTITDGEGVGSVVETHATPLTGPGVHPATTVMTEAVVATSDRMGFRLARSLAPLVRLGMRASATSSARGLINSASRSPFFTWSPRLRL